MQVSQHFIRSVYVNDVNYEIFVILLNNVVTSDIYRVNFNLFDISREILSRPAVLVISEI